jgi:hypothetical protein
MKTHLIASLLIITLFVACSPTEDGPRFVEIEDQPAAESILYVTPTIAPTLVPTAVRIVPSLTPTATIEVLPTATPLPPTATVDPVVMCDAVLDTLYTTASNLCLAGPSGYFCNGGLPPISEPTGPVANALSVAGALVEAAELDSVRTSPLATNNSGGVAWLRLEDDIKMDALMIGDIQIKNTIETDSEFAKWQSFTIESQTVESPCDDVQETGALVVQGLYGQSTRLVINGVSVDLNGTIVALTQETTTKFIAIEGRVRLISFGQPVILNAGQQLTMTYHSGDWTSPAGLPGNPEVLDYDLIKNLPIVLFDRPVKIPQPGFVQTEGRVNMRTEPDINSQLLFQVPAEETMSVLGLSTDREWLHIRLGNGETGWMSAELLVQNIGIIQQVYDSTPEPPQRLGELASQANVIVGQGGNLREAPDVGFGVKQTIPYGKDVELLARSPYSPWVKVDVDGEIGWMALITIETESVISSLPIDYTVPLPPRPTAVPSFGFGGGHAYPNPNGGF